MSEAGVSDAHPLLERAAEAIREADLARRHGFVTNLIGLIIEATGLQAEVGEVCLVGTDRNRAAVAAEVVGFREGRTLLMPLGELHGIGPGTRVLASGAPFRVAVGESLLGQVLDGLGNPADRQLAVDPAHTELGAAGLDGGGDPTSTCARRSLRPRARSPGRASASASGWVCARWTASCHVGAGSGWESSPAQASASPRCSA